MEGKWERGVQLWRSETTSWASAAQSLRLSEQSGRLDAHVWESAQRAVGSDVSDVRSAVVVITWCSGMQCLTNLWEWLDVDFGGLESHRVRLTRVEKHRASRAS